MKPLLSSILALGLLSACVQHPSITEYDPVTGKKIARYSTGTNVAAKIENMVAEVRGPGGRAVKFMVGKEDATEVPMEGLRTVLGIASAKQLGMSTRHAETQETARAATAAKVQMNKDTLDAAGKATSEALPLMKDGPQVLPVKPPGS